MFQELTVGETYSRPDLAAAWGYAGYQAIARGVVTPSGSRFIILFVTEEKQDSLRDYDDKLVGNELHWEGPDDHFAERRMVNASKTSDEIHVFFRKRHHSNFRYLGRAQVTKADLETAAPSKFTLKLVEI